jgi:hypothetical protein
MITQLNPPLPVVTPLGRAQAHFVWEVSIEHYVMFLCWHDKTGECFVFPHHVLRLTPNISNGHPTHTPIQTVPGLEPHLHRYEYGLKFEGDPE